MQTDTKEYFNFINTINSEHSKQSYMYCLQEFLDFCKLDLQEFLKLPQENMTDIIIEFLVQKKVSKSWKKVYFFAIKHAAEVNDVLGINWKKIRLFIRSEKTGNEIFGKDRGYLHKEVQQILSFSDQRVKTCFLILASTGIRIGALDFIKLGDLERIDDLYKFTIYPGDKEQYITFCTPECAKEIDSYLEFRKRNGEKLNQNSYLIIKRFSKYQNMEHFQGLPFKVYSLKSLLQDTIEKSGLRQSDHNRSKRKEVPFLHGFRKFFTKQLVDSNVKAEIREMLLGHKIGLTSVYYKPTEKDKLTEYYKAVPLLTISDEERLKFKLEEHVQIQKTTIQSMQEQMAAFQAEIKELKRKRK